MAYELVICKECNNEVEVKFDGDNASMCPECRSVDCFEEIEDELCSNCNGSGEGQYDGTKCTVCKGSGVLK